MIGLITDSSNYKIMAFIGIIFAYILTHVLLHYCKEMLPRDGGRAFAHDGKLSAGKPRGAGIIFILVFAAASILFLKINLENIIYIVLLIAAMLTGYLDDASKSPWGEYKKGFLDLIISVLTAVTFMYYNSSSIYINIIGKSFTLNPVLFVILGTILVWAAINVTNCSDGVDGLSGTLAIITLITIYFIGTAKDANGSFSYMILMMVVSIMAYLWFNATPSKMLMGDAGSRAMGLFISIAILKTGSPLLYIPVSFVFIVDGGLGLIKVALLRFLKIKIIPNIRTPLHDHVRKNKDWSNTQTVFRFAIIQILIGFCTVWLLK
ncbi:phospho-N-acetylmuramoyl-pentapeptide-transferase [Clostridium oryzae]|uniref:Phospho-N-acetylmuramoyl-pentapeptide-transferase n=1 Tax=Clostridium oryzae TaxID=1450648 RepID=A0A1V4IJH3_9CLOT|nr:phospho-N-acetylmuramoyl-pentapeptide-transferase [Clostridium oryzae]OPJ59974.1 phospho-N-acetylmuramoyl-pentapeptide-transferase [Clostridium oryzae]